MYAFAVVVAYVNVLCEGIDELQHAQIKLCWILLHLIRDVYSAQAMS